MFCEDILLFVELKHLEYLFKLIIQQQGSKAFVYDAARTYKTQSC